ncbi:MAG: BsuPI-related putative proteinase inhibitor [Bryobacteraceae bacterium]
MSGTRISILSLFAAALAAQTLYLPLDEGNLWLYHGNGGSFVIEVGRSAEFHGNLYHAVRGLVGSGEAWLRNDAEGRILMWDEGAGEERVLLDPASPEGHAYRTWADPCNREALIETRNGRYSGPVGEFDFALVVRYRPGPCVDVGLDSEYWLPWVGLLRRVRITIAGPRQHDLVYARLGGVTYVRAPETGFALSLIPSGNTLLAVITLRHTLAWPLTLHFSSSQRFDIIAYDSNGNEFYQWSHGKLFLTVMGEETVCGERSWIAEIPVGDWPKGDYAIRAWLTPLEGHAWSAVTLYRH